MPARLATVTFLNAPASSVFEQDTNVIKSHTGKAFEQPSELLPSRSPTGAGLPRTAATRPLLGRLREPEKADLRSSSDQSDPDGPPLPLGQSQLPGRLPAGAGRLLTMVSWPSGVRVPCGVLPPLPRRSDVPRRSRSWGCRGCAGQGGEAAHTRGPSALVFLRAPAPCLYSW